MMFKRPLFLVAALFLSSNNIFAQDTQRDKAENAELERLTELHFQAMDKDMEKAIARRDMAMDETMYKISRKKNSGFFLIPRQEQALSRLA